MRATAQSLLCVSMADHTALGTFTSEDSLLKGTNQLPVFPALYFDGALGRGRRFRFKAKGVLSCTGTPTYLFTARLGSTGTAATDTVIGITAAITCASGITNKEWEFSLEMTCRTPGQGAGNTTLAGAGWVTSPGGFAAPYTYPVQPTAPDTATWTVAPISSALLNYLQLGATCSASSASNAITCKDWSLEDLG